MAQERSGRISYVDNFNGKLCDELLCRELFGNTLEAIVPDSQHRKCSTCADSPIRDVRLANCRFENVAEESTVEHVEHLQMEDVFVNGERVG